uniref:2'-5' oligoadenylate synthase n=1 Tax=Callorhinchus milii TaxID=7868 RepID=A0A4W3JKQ9_CALMI
MQQSLYQTGPRQLDTFIGNLRPNDFNKQLKEAVHRICSFLRDDCFQNKPIKVKRVVKGGSSGKGTAMRSGSDADLVVFLDCFSSYQDQRGTRTDILEEISKVLTKYQRSIAYEIQDIKITFPPTSSSIPPKSLSFTIQSKKSVEQVDFDLLPTFDALGLFGDNAYVKLIEIGDSAGEFSPCFTEHQRDFVKLRPAKLKDLIRLVKHWYIQYVKPRKNELTNGNRIPQKYAVELLTIHAWEQNGKLEGFKTAEGFRTVLELICRYRELCIYWNHYYKLSSNGNKALTEFVKRKLRGTRPVILDPADPTGNVGQSGGWQVMVSEASKCLQMPCMAGVQSWDLKPVTELQVNVQLMGGSSLLINANPFTKVATIKQTVQQHWRNFSPSRQSPPVPVHQQRLMFNNTILNDSETLLESGILDNVPITLLVTSNNKMDIFVRNSDGHNRTYQVQPTDTVLSLKKKIEAAEHIHSNQYYLVFGGRTLEDKCTLQYYNIKEHSHIDMNLRLRGGGICQSNEANVSLCETMGFYHN